MYINLHTLFVLMKTITTKISTHVYGSEAPIKLAIIRNTREILKKNKYLYTGIHKDRSKLVITKPWPNLFMDILGQTTKI